MLLPNIASANTTNTQISTCVASLMSCSFLSRVYFLAAQ